MRSLILTSFILSSVFGAYPGTGVVDPATGKNYYVDWQPLVTDASVKGASSGSCSMPSVFIPSSLLILEISGVRLPSPYQDSCWIRGGKLTPAPDCPTGEIFYTDGGCYTPCPSDKTKVVLSDGKCHEPPLLDPYSCDSWCQFKKYAADNPTQMMGFGLAFGAAALVGVGLIAPETAGVALGGAAGLISLGIHSVVAGTAVIASLPSPNDPKMTFPNGSDGGKPIRIDLIDYVPSNSASDKPVIVPNAGSSSSSGSSGSSGSTPTTSVAPTSSGAGVNIGIVDNNGRVTDLATVPNSITTALATTPIDLTSSTPPVPNPSTSLAGLQQTTYDYSGMTATTTTHTSGSMVGNPQTTTTMAPITISQNGDGTTSTTSSNPAVPSVTSTTSGGSVVTQPSTASGSNSNNNPHDILGDTTNEPLTSDGLGVNTNYTGDDTQAQKDLADGSNSVKNLGDNIYNSYNNIKELYNNDLNLLKGKGFTPFVIPSGDCGQNLAFTVRNTTVDLCPPLTKSLSQSAPIFSNVTFIGGVSVAISIFLGGF